MISIFAGATYKLEMDNLTGCYYYSNLEEATEQHSFNLIQMFLAAWWRSSSLKTDSALCPLEADDGSSNVDNKALAQCPPTRQRHKLLAWAIREMNGDTGFAFRPAAEVPILILVNLFM